MSDWSIMMINTAAEMKGKTEEEVLQAVMKESGSERAEIITSLEDKPDHVKRSALVTMLARARYRSGTEVIRRTEMSDWSATMSLTAAEMRNNTTEEVMQIVAKELGMRQSVINARLKDKPARVHKMILMTMITNARYQAAERANSIRDRRRKIEKMMKN